MTPNKYVVEYCYGDHNEWSDEIADRDIALNHAAVSSELVGVSETRVWCEDELLATFVDGEEKDDEILIRMEGKKEGWADRFFFGYGTQKNE